jgi:hypothetical protein
MMGKFPGWSPSDWTLANLQISTLDATEAAPDLVNPSGKRDPAIQDKSGRRGLM